MRIASSDVQLTSAHQATVRSEVRERLQFVRGGRTQVEPETDRPVESAERPAHSVNISTQARRMSERALESTLNTVRGPQPGARPTTATITATNDEEDSKEPEIGDLRSQLVRALFERLTGRKMEIEALDTSPPETTAPPLSGPPPPGQAPPPGEVVEASGFSYERTETYEETEAFAFSARAVIRTADGQELEVGVDVQMSRRFFEETKIELGVARATLEEGTKKDPLVVNFDAPAALLNDSTSSFDVDGDGTREDIRFVGPGSGFLALDRNENGDIDDGTELFGARTGDGFEELSALDDDKNGWIDETDAAFEKLELFTRDESGKERRLSLSEAGVGAIHLGRVSTPFDHKDAQNRTLASVRTTGFYVAEVGGRAGSVQQLDLVV